MKKNYELNEKMYIYAYVCMYIIRKLLRARYNRNISSRKIIFNNKGFEMALRVRDT